MGDFTRTRIATPLRGLLLLVLFITLVALAAFAHSLDGSPRLLFLGFLIPLAVVALYLAVLQSRLIAHVGIRTKLLLLLSATLAIFVTGLAVQQHFEHQRMNLLVQHAAEERRDFLGKLVTLKGDGVRAGAFDYTYWDEFVEYLASRDSSWAAENLETFLLTYRADVLWVYGLDGSLLYSRLVREGEFSVAGDIPGRPEAIGTLSGENRTSHFFARSPLGLLEIEGGTIHTTKDRARKGPYFGYFFVGGLWDQQYLDELGRLADGVASLESEPFSSDSPSGLHGGLIRVWQDLEGWDRHAVARIYLRAESGSQMALARVTRQDMALVACFSVLLVALIYLSLTYWVSNPLRLISTSLKAGAPSLVLPLTEDRTEFGQLALLIQHFFQQRDALAQEVAIRRAAEQEVRTLNEKLEQRVAERTLQLQLEVADRRRAEQDALRVKEEAEAASHAKSEFLAVTSHELRTPLTGIMGMTEILKETDLDKDQRIGLDTLCSCTESLLAMINNILDFASASSGKLVLAVENFDLVDAVEEATEGMTGRIQGKGLELICDIDPAVPMRVRGDEPRLRQLITILLENAAKFTERGEVVVRVTLSSMMGTHAVVRVEVTDTGIGIPREGMAKLFEMFSQVDSSNTRRYGGAGLGLALAKHLAELLGGGIGVESEVGVGSTFWFTATFEESPETAVRRDDGSPDEGSRDARRPRVLVADRNATTRTVLAAMVSAGGLRSDTAADSAETLDRMREAAGQEDPYRMALVEDGMSPLSGFELGRAIRNTPELRDTALILLLPAGQRKNEAVQRSQDFAAHLFKPVRRSALLALLEQLAHRAPPHGTYEGSAQALPERSAGRLEGTASRRRWFMGAAGGVSEHMGTAREGES